MLYDLLSKLLCSIFGYLCMSGEVLRFSYVFISYDYLINLCYMIYFLSYYGLFFVIFV